MHFRRWALALPLVLAASIASTHASTIRDNAGLFSTDAVRQAQSRLDKLEQDNPISVTIETIDSLEGRDIDAVLEERAKQNRAKPGLYVLIVKREHKIEVESSKRYAKVLTKARNKEVRDAFVAAFEKRDFNAGLNSGLESIERVLSGAKADSGGAIRAAAPAVPAPRGGAAPRGRQGLPAAPGGGFGLSSLLGIGLLVLAVLFGVRLLGSLFGGGNRGYAGQQRMGGPGYGAPGYGGGGMGGGGGGGFMSSMFGGIGGALAGNWLYDQFSGGRSHGGTTDQSSMGTGADGGAVAGGDAGNEWGGSDGGADWGGDAGTAGDAGGGGDWGGGGGGGGGDWGGGGGGGGGDWGGGGGDSGGGGGGDW